MKDGEPLRLERSAKFLSQMRKARLQHKVVDTTLDNKAFVNRYSKCVYEAMEAEHTHQKMPRGDSSILEPIATWRSQRTKSGSLTKRAQNFQNKALEDLTAATDVLKQAEKKLGFAASRDGWTQWLQTDFQIFMASIASAKQKDLRLIEFCIVLQYLGFFHIDFISDELNIGLVQDCARWVGCKFAVQVHKQFITLFSPMYS
jgi:YesN/AraC family two-component response regulator